MPSSASEVLLSVALEVADCAPLSKNQFCGQNKNAPIDFGTVGGGLNGYGSSESTLQTQFVSGLPHENQSVHDAESVYVQKVWWEWVKNLATKDAILFDQFEFE